jgi:hypothetical protein
MDMGPDAPRGKRSPLGAAGAVGHVSRVGGGKRQPRAPDAPAGNETRHAIARIATRQRGLITTAQLLRAGLGPDAIEYRAQTGELHRLHRGVYA